MQMRVLHGLCALLALLPAVASAQEDLDRLPPEFTYAVLPYSVEIRGLPELKDLESSYWTEVDITLGGYRIHSVSRLRNRVQDEDGEEVFEVPLAGRSADVGFKGDGLTFTTNTIAFKRSVLIHTYRLKFLQEPPVKTTLDLEPQDGEAFTRVGGTRLAYTRRVIIKRLGRMQVTLVYLVTKERTPLTMSYAEFLAQQKTREADSKSLVAYFEGRYPKSAERRAKNFKETLDALEEEKRERRKR